jgi:hypothetical protein
LVVCLQALLKPIVSQFVIEPPEHFESVPEAPSVDEVDETLVLCLGQMAVTARSDVLWKPLNHEVGTKHYARSSFFLDNGQVRLEMH